jgi:CRISPR-associated exonuclease Cas4
MKTAHEAQVKYYLFKRKQYGIEGVTGILEYPTLRHTSQIIRTDDHIQLIEKWGVNSMEIISGEEMQGVIDKPV